MFWLRPVKYLSERSLDNTSASHIWNIKGQYFGSGQSSICLKDQLTILHLIRSSKKCFSLQKQFRKKFFLKINYHAYQISCWSANQLIRLVDQIIQKILFFSRFFFRKKLKFFYHLIRSVDQIIQKMIFFSRIFFFWRIFLEKKHFEVFLSAD